LTGFYRDAVGRDTLFGHQRVKGIEHTLIRER
jgi:hypothetical protein